MCLRERKDRERDVQRARNGTWDIIREKRKKAKQRSL
jgi:hypothetical protein